MGKLIKEGDEKSRLHIDTPLMGESLVSKKLLESTESTDYFRMHPDINVIKIGGAEHYGPWKQNPFSDSR
jgi:molybdenum storage protein